MHVIPTEGVVMMLLTLRKGTKMVLVQYLLSYTLLSNFSKLNSIPCCPSEEKEEKITGVILSVGVHKLQSV